MENEMNAFDSLEYLSLNKIQRIGYRIKHFFCDIPKKIQKKAYSLPSKARKKKSTFLSIFKNILDAFKEGDVFTRLSFLLMGISLMKRHQVIRGILYFLFEIGFVLFMVFIGGNALGNLSTLGTLSQIEYKVIDKDSLIDISMSVLVDNSFTILLYSVLSLVLIVLLVYLWYTQLKDGFYLQKLEEVGKYASDRQTLKNVLDKSYDKTLLSLPIGGLFLFTVVPILVMILIAFTDYDYLHVTPTKLFDWVGFYNLNQVFSTASSNTNSDFIKIFGQVLLWTLLWAFFATFSNYFLGMIVAMIINIKGIKLKKVWRTILITTIAVPQFVSLMLVSFMFGNSSFSIVNALLLKVGWIQSPIGWLSNSAFAALLPKVIIILVNTWIGIPYTMLICTGLLMNIPEDLYESARIDGASPFVMYRKITLPYMLFVTGPYLLSQFIGNINNFNVIYLLSGGGPSFTFDMSNGTVPAVLISSNVGQTDLLITWIYKLTTNKNFDYGLACILGIIVFALIAFFSLIFYNHSNSVNNEEAFQ